ncbi:Mo-co oxidoreductase dimerisation domain-containing protein [Hymenobacter mucosus]|uniref:Mo-co oxidoreductase dimerisation domain-containing protein n=2 Tax=Hymenobacter mucosus TaxID=1411120 RepID=A0A239AG69_9BACT|nr:Mo-co oxidoreductase dimerisation domain-containing protein [Hymenobacter mucosus]
MSGPAALSGVMPTLGTMRPDDTAAATGRGTFPGLITREKEPLNLEFPFPTLEAPLVPTNRFYIRSHFPIPQLDTTSWRLHIGGEVREELNISYDELQNMPSKTVTATLECAGNGRARLTPKAKGLLWEQGAVGNAEWTGVPLSALLARAGIKAEAVEVIFEGADQGEIKEEPKSPGVIHFARSLPLAKANQGEVLVVYLMNGKPLSPEHGFPVRLVVPGWYGMASVKWLHKITVSATPFEGYWQTIEYAYWRREHGQPALTAITEMQVKAEIARPALHEVIPIGQPYRIFGAAWTGESEVTCVDVSTDNGSTWQPAELLDASTPFAWRMWEMTWTPHAPGRYTLMARATDRAGHTQPTEHTPDRRTYMINRISAVEVTAQ